MWHALSEIALAEFRRLANRTIVPTLNRAVHVWVLNKLDSNADQRDEIAAVSQEVGDGRSESSSASNEFCIF